MSYLREQSNLRTSSPTEERRFTRFPLRIKLIITFLLIALIPLGALIFIYNQLSREALTEAASQRLLAAAAETAGNIDSFVNDTLTMIEAEAQLPQIVEFLTSPEETRPDEGNPLSVTLNTLKNQSEYINTYGILDRNGRNVSDSNQGLLDNDESARDYFRVPFNTTEPYVSPVLREDDGPIIYFSTPIYNDSNDIVGVLRVQYDGAVLETLLRSGNELSSPRSQASVREGQTFAILLDEHFIRLVDTASPDLAFQSVISLEPDLAATLQDEGRLLTLPDEALSPNLVAFAEGLRNVSSRNTFAGTAHPGANLEQIAVVQTDRQQPGWFVVFGQEQSAFLQPVEQQLRFVFLLALITSAVVAVVALVISRQLSRPIIDLTEAARRVTEGDLGVETTVKSRDETRQLAAAFNKMTSQLRHAIGTLESQVEERTNDLVLSMEVGQRAASIRDLQTLLPKITEFIRTQFELYYVHVYLVDDTGQLLVMRSGTGRVGQTLLERGHSLPVGSGSIVGRVAAEGQSIMVPDTGTSSIHMPNPLLPETRSELAVPLKVEGQVLGVLDMQADQVNTFTENNRTVFEAMATQLAIAIDGARQWTAAQESQQRLETALNQLTHEAWVNKLGQRTGKFGFSYDLAAVKPVDPDTGSDEPAIPLMVQNEKIGHLSVKASNNRTLSPDEQDLLAAVAQQLAQKAENIRLFEETQRQAAREQMARQITDRIRASRDIETALKTAAEELSKALGTAKTVIDLQVTPESQQMVEPLLPSEKLQQDESHE